MIIIILVDAHLGYPPPLHLPHRGGDDERDRPLLLLRRLTDACPGHKQYGG